MLIGIFSVNSGGASQRRLEIRESAMLSGSTALGVDARFVLQCHDNTTRHEQRRYGDLMVLGMLDEKSVGHITYAKVDAFFRRALQRRARYKWYAKCDDDTYVVIPQLHRELMLIGPNVSDGYYGVHCGSFERDEDAVLRWFMCGAFYALSADVAAKVVREPLGQRGVVGSKSQRFPAWAMESNEDRHMRERLRSLRTGRNAWSCGFHHCHDAPGTGNLHLHQRPLSGETVFVHQVKHPKLFARVAGYFAAHAEAIQVLAAQRDGPRPWAAKLGHPPAEPDVTLSDFFRPYCAW